MLRRELRYSEDSFAAFFRLGAQCWGPRVADPRLALTLAQEDPEKVAQRKKKEEELMPKGLKTKKQMAIYRKLKQAKYFALVNVRKVEKQKKKVEKQKEKEEKMKKRDELKKKREELKKKRDELKMKRQDTKKKREELQKKKKEELQKKKQQQMKMKQLRNKI
jgi:hypothetical protein